MGVNGRQWKWWCAEGYVEKARVVTAMGSSEKAA